MMLTVVCFYYLAVLAFGSSINGNNDLESKVLDRLGNFESYLKQQDERIKILETTVLGQRKHIQHLETQLKQGKGDVRLTRG